MILQQFEVAGYKNLTQSIKFGPLGSINVIHGPNNVGKSNLLQAMDLYFRLLDLVSLSPDLKDRRDPVGAKMIGTLDSFEQLGHPVSEIFNFIKPAPLELMGTFSFTAEEQEQFGFGQILSAIQKIGIRASIQTLPGSLEDGLEVQIVHLTSGMTSPVLKKTLKFLGKLRQPQAQKTGNRFVLLGVNRRSRAEDITPPSLHIVPQLLRDALFDAKESREAAVVRRWELFVEAMKQFESTLGHSGRFETAFDRPNNQADLVFDSGDMREPVDLLGSGVQQIVALLGQLLLTPATLIGIEEPELNLRYTLQKQLLAAFKQIINSKYGPQQLFLTTHSNAFEARETFFAMDIKDGIPTLSEKPRHLAWIETGMGKGEEDVLIEMHHQDPKPVCYVSSEGLVQLPNDVRQQLNVEHGGGVSFIPNKESKHFEIWTLDEVEQWFAGDEDDDS